MRKLHPRLGMLEVIDESPLFYRVSTTYDFWIPKADFGDGKPTKPRKLKRAKGETVDVTIEHAAPPQEIAEEVEGRFVDLTSRAAGVVGAYIVKEDDKWMNVVQFVDTQLAVMFTAALQKAMADPQPVKLHVKPFVN